jgi:hypothetical protein
MYDLVFHVQKFEVCLVHEVGSHYGLQFIFRWDLLINGEKLKIQENEYRRHRNTRCAGAKTTSSPPFTG